MDRQQQSGFSLTALLGIPSSPGPDQLQQIPQQQHQSAFSAVQPKMTKLPGCLEPPTMPLPTVFNPFLIYQPFYNGYLPSPEPFGNFIPGFNMAPLLAPNMLQQLQTAPALTPTVQATIPGILPDTVIAIASYLNSIRPAQQPLLQQLQPDDNIRSSSVDSGTESIRSPDTSDSRSSSASCDSSLTLMEEAAARFNSDLLEAVRRTNEQVAAASSLNSSGRSSLESRASTPKRYAPYPQLPAVSRPVAAPQQDYMQQMTMSALSNPLPYHIESPLIMKEHCVVCGDRASGFHYGVCSCEGCKGFFRRSITKKEIYYCVRKNECVINKETRARCPACRMTKCFAQGMSRELVRPLKRNNKRKEREAEERRETIDKTVTSYAKYQRLIEQCTTAYSHAFPEGTRIASKEDALTRTEKFVSSLQLLADCGKNVAERALDRVVIVRAAYTADSCDALNPDADAVMCLQKVLSAPSGAPANLQLPLSLPLVAVATAIEVVAAADIRADRTLETLLYSLQFQLTREHAAPLYNDMGRLLGRGSPLSENPLLTKPAAAQ